MTRHPRSVGVLGSGVMGSAIAAHFANAGIPSLVLDIVPPEARDPSDRKARDRIAVTSVAALLKSRPAPLFTKARRSLIRTGNLEDDLPKLAQVDWVIEAVREDMGIKKKLLAAVAEHLAPTALLTSNTSGLSLTEMAGALPEAVRPRFLGTHFFNPPRYMRLMELIPTPYTSPEVLEQVETFCTDRLGKGVVRAKDTPNFIANRVGTHGLMGTLNAMQELGLTIEEVDALTGPAMGRPKTATFRLADLIGVDTLLLVARHVHAAVVDDEARDQFLPPEFMERMVEKGLHGRKAGAGFYKKVKGAKPPILTLDLDSYEYRPPAQPQLPELLKLKGIEDPGERCRALVQGEGRAAQAAWSMLAPTLSYAASCVGEIADSAEPIDRALKLGFNWELGPFELWDALGFRETTERLRAEGRPLPAWVDRLYESGGTSLYSRSDGELQAPTAQPGATVAVPADPRAFDFELLRGAGGELRRNASASLLDLGDGVLGLEFHSKMNTIDASIIEMIGTAVDEAETGWRALVVANQGANFSAGANLKLIVEHAQAGDWEAIRNEVIAFQTALNNLERCAVPVVTAPHGLTLGGGCEVTMAGNAIRASAESYVGLVEVGAGLIPAGGGCLRLYKRNVATLQPGSDLYPALRKTFETIGMAKVATSAEEAREIGFLRPQDGWSMNSDFLVADAKATALGLAASGYAAPNPLPDLPVAGRAGLALIEMGLVNMVEGRFITEHDRTVGRELARILSGGDLPGPTTMPESRLLELEQESFLRLCGEPKTQERMLALLKTGKPLRN